MTMTDAESFSELRAHYKDVIRTEVRLDCVVLSHVLLANDVVLSLSTLGVVKVFSETETEKKWGFYANRISPIFSKGVRPNPQSFSVFVSFSENKVGKRRTETEKNRGFYGLTVNSKMSERELTLSGGHLPSKSSKFLCSLLWGCQSFIFEGQYD